MNTTVWTMKVVENNLNWKMPHHDPIVIMVYQLVLYLEFALSFVIYPLVIFTIFRKSPQEMGLYTWFLALNITANYAYCFLICIWQVRKKN
jgi:hypothetical protein